LTVAPRASVLGEFRSRQLQFENLILKNRPSVWAKVGIGADDIVFDNPYWQTATQKTRGHVNGVDDSILEERYFDTVIDFGELWSYGSPSPAFPSFPPRWQ
jgi:hypothetical protein